MVVLDLLERAADHEEEITAALLAEFTGAGGIAPPKGHELREEFERWAEDAGCRVRGGAMRAPMIGGKPLFRVAQGKWINGELGKRWSGEVADWCDGGWSGAGGQVRDDWEVWRERTADLISRWWDVHRFAQNPPTVREIEEGWAAPSWLALEQHEAAILEGCDPETGLPLPVVDWLGRLIHGPKREYARAYCSHRLLGDPEPADPETPWAAKARKRAEVVLRAVAG